LQDDWGGGMYQGRRSPANAVYDALNALINDEGFPFKRGGSAFYSNSDAGNTLLALYDEFLAAGQRTVAISSSSSCTGSTVWLRSMCTPTRRSLTYTPIARAC
jgi:hypothetical protein